jgi:IclR family pca regulon transcriptional regulator
LEEVRRKGYAINDEELSVGLRSVAAPIRDANGLAIAATNIAVPTKRYSLKDIVDVLSPQIIDTAELISKALREIECEAKLIA